MASLTIRNIDDGLKQKLRIRAAEHGVSMEEEARRLIQRAVEMPSSGQRSEPEAATIFARLAALGRAPERPFDQKAVADELWNFIK